MSGPNQHYIPRFLQRAFGIRPRRREIWYFGRGQVVEQRLIKRTASEDFFYSQPSADGSSTLDDAITTKESDLAALLKEVRAASPGEAIASQLAAATVSHLTQRTAHLRAALGEGVARMLDRAEQTFAKRDNIEVLMGLDDGVPTQRFRSLVMKDLAGRPEIAQLGIPTRVLERTAFLFAKENSGEMAATASALLGELRPQSPELVRDSHNRALGDMIDSGEYEAFLRTFDWSDLAGLRVDRPGTGGRRRQSPAHRTEQSTGIAPRGFARKAARRVQSRIHAATRFRLQPRGRLFEPYFLHGPAQ